MSEPDAESVEEIDEEQANLLVVSADDYIRTRKTKEIMDARKEVRKARKTAEDRDEQEVLVAEAVAEYAMELEPLMRDTEFGRKLLNEKEYGVDPDYPVKGLSEYMNLMGYIKPTGRGNLKPPEPPISMVAYRDCNEFLRRVGLDLNLEEDKGPAEV